MNDRECIHENSHDTGSLIAVTVVAAAVGAVAAILLAPQSGRKTRREIAQRARATRDYAQEEYEEVKGIAQDGAHQAAALARDVKREVSELADDANVRARRTKQKFDVAAGDIEAKARSAWNKKN